jgi:xanthine/uracil/vitamin C permease (AzgA family)
MTEILPVFLTIVLIPLSYSITAVGGRRRWFPIR